eukprot:4131798-Prymnesium_polylepis.2
MPDHWWVANGGVERTVSGKRKAAATTSSVPEMTPFPKPNAPSARAPRYGFSTAPASALRMPCVIATASEVPSEAWSDSDSRTCTPETDSRMWTNVPVRRVTYSNAPPTAPETRACMPCFRP